MVDDFTTIFKFNFLHLLDLSVTFICFITICYDNREKFTKEEDVILNFSILQLSHIE